MGKKTMEFVNFELMQSLYSTLPSLLADTPSGSIRVP
jgi:hypothetical protein